MKHEAISSLLLYPLSIPCSPVTQNELKNSTELLTTWHKRGKKRHTEIISWVISQKNSMDNFSEHFHIQSNPANPTKEQIYQNNF